MTDNEIIKALKEILEIMLAMGDLQKAEIEQYKDYNAKWMQKSEEQQAEIERLKGLLELKEFEYDDMVSQRNIFEKLLEKAETKISSFEYDMELLKQEKAVVQAEAVKEFAERLKGGSNGWIEISAADIDNLLKETVGDAE